MCRCLLEEELEEEGAVDVSGELEEEAVAAAVGVSPAMLVLHVVECGWWWL